MWKFLEKRPFFRADLAGLGKYCTGGFGRIGVHRVNVNLYGEVNIRFCITMTYLQRHFSCPMALSTELHADVWSRWYCCCASFTCVLDL